jgi:hypothetical protein
VGVGVGVGVGSGFSVGVGVGEGSGVEDATSLGGGSDALPKLAMGEDGEEPVMPGRLMVTDATDAAPKPTARTDPAVLSERPPRTFCRQSQGWLKFT